MTGGHGQVYGVTPPRGLRSSSRRRRRRDLVLSKDTISYSRARERKIGSDTFSDAKLPSPACVPLGARGTTELGRTFPGGAGVRFFLFLFFLFFLLFFLLFIEEEMKSKLSLALSLSA